MSGNLMNLYLITTVYDVLCAWNQTNSQVLGLFNCTESIPQITLALVKKFVPLGMIKDASSDLIHNMVVIFLRLLSFGDFFMGSQVGDDENATTLRRGAGSSSQTEDLRKMRFENEVFDNILSYLRDFLSTASTHFQIFLCLVEQYVS